MSALLLCLALAFQDPDPRDWPQFMRTPEHTGDAAEETLALPLGLVAQVRRGDAILTSPAVVGPRAYVVDQMGTAACVEWRTGRTVWTASPDGGGARGSNTSSPCVARGRVYFGTTAGSFHVLDAETGAAVRTVRLDASVTGSPTWANDSVYLQTAGSVLYCFDLDGQERWRWDHYKDYARAVPEELKRQHPGSYTRPHYGGGEVAVSGKRVVTHFGWDQVCLEDDGRRPSLVWCTRAALGKDDGIPMSASLSGGFAFTAWPGVDAAGSLLRVSLKDGSFDPKADQVHGKWAILGTPAVRGNAVFFGRNIRGVEAYEFGKGGLWALHGSSEADGFTPSISSPALTREHAVFTTLAGELVVASLAAKGSPASRVEPRPFRFRTPYGKAIGSSPAVSQGHVFFGGDDGFLYVLGPGGKLDPAPEAPDVSLPRSPVQSPTGRVYAWPSPYGGPGNAKFVDDAGLKPPFSLRYAVRGFGVFKQPPSASDRDLFFADLAGFVACLEQETGRLRWRVKLPRQEWASGGVLSGDGRVYVMRNGVRAGPLNAVFCLDAATGAVLWHREVGAPGDHHYGRAAPLLVDGRLISGAVRGDPPALAVEAWDARSGEPAWTVAMNASGRGVRLPTGAAEGGVVYFTGGADKPREGGGETVAIEASSGRVLWRTADVYCPGSGAPVVRDGRLYTSGWDWPVACLSTKDGAALWKMEKKQYWFHGPALGPDFLTARGYGGHAYRFDLEGKRQGVMIGSEGFT
jgi:outer membrane protein assembly factor BamB